MKISSLCCIKFTDENGHDDSFVDGGLPIVPLNRNVLIRWEEGDEHIQTIHLVNEKSKVKTSLTLIPVNNDAYLIKFQNVPCGIYRLQVNDGYLTGRKILSLPFRIVRNSKGIVQIRTTNFNDDRYSRNNLQEYNYYYAYLANWVERTKENVTKYDNERGNVIPLVSHAYNTYDLQTTATAQHTINLLNEISNNDFINVSFLNRQGERQYFEVKRTSEAPSNTNYNRTNQGTFAATFVGEYTGTEIRVNPFIPSNSEIADAELAAENYQNIPVSELCNGITNIEFNGYTYDYNDLLSLNLANVTELPNNFLNVQISQTFTLKNSANVRKIGNDFGDSTSRIDADFSNVESVGKNFKAAIFSGAINLPNKIVSLNIGSWSSTKFFGNNVEMVNCNTSVLANTGITISRVTNCFVDSVNLAFSANAVVEKSTFQAFTIVGGVATPTNFQLPKIEGLKIKDCDFELIDGFNYNLDLSKFEGIIENSFHFANNQLTTTEDSAPTFAVDNDSFTGAVLNSDYLKQQIDNIKRSNSSSDVYKNEIQVSGIRDGVSTTFAVKRMTPFLMEINDQNTSNELFNSATDVITFLVSGEYWHPEHFLENGKVDSIAPLNFRDGTHHFSNYFCNNLQIQTIQVYYSQFIELCRLKSFNPACNALEIYDDGEDFDLYYFVLASDTLSNIPTLKLSATLTDLHDKLIEVGYPSGSIENL